MTSAEGAKDSDPGTFGLVIGGVIISIPLWLVVEAVLTVINVFPGTGIWRFVVITVAMLTLVFIGDSESPSPTTDVSSNEEYSEGPSHSFYSELRKEHEEKGIDALPTAPSNSSNSANSTKNWNDSNSSLSSQDSNTKKEDSKGPSHSFYSGLKGKNERGEIAYSSATSSKTSNPSESPNAGNISDSTSNTGANHSKNQNSTSNTQPVKEVKRQHNKNHESVSSSTTPSSNIDILESVEESEKSLDQTTSLEEKEIKSLSDALSISKHFGTSRRGRGKLKKKLQSMNEYDFEKLVADLWSREGWNTNVTDPSGDRGIDVVATRTGLTTEKQVIQAKRYTEGNTVGSKEVRTYATLRQQESDADSVVLVTTSQFTKQATRLATDLRVKLVDGESLSQRISQLADSIPKGSIASDREDDYVNQIEKIRRLGTVLESIKANQSNYLIDPIREYTHMINDSEDAGEQEHIYYSNRISNRVEKEQKRLRKLSNLELPNGYEQIEDDLDKYIDSCQNLAAKAEVYIVSMDDDEQIERRLLIVAKAFDEVRRAKRNLVNSISDRVESK